MNHMLKGTATITIILLTVGLIKNIVEMSEYFSQRNLNEQM